MKYVVIGRTGAGKKTFLKSLAENGIKVGRFYAVNPGTCSEIAEAHVIGTDISGLKKLCAANPRESFRIINIQMADDDRLRGFISKIPPEDKIKAEEEFIAACLNENEEHAEFERLMTNREAPYGLNNIIKIQALINDATDKSPIFTYHEEIKTGLLTHSRMRRIISDLLRENILEVDGEGRSVKFQAADGGYKTASLDVFTEYVLADADGMLAVFMCWLKSAAPSKL